MRMWPRCRIHKCSVGDGKLNFSAKSYFALVFFLCFSPTAEVECSCCRSWSFASDIALLGLRLNCNGFASSLQKGCCKSLAISDNEHSANFTPIVPLERRPQLLTTGRIRQKMHWCRWIFFTKLMPEIVFVDHPLTTGRFGAFLGQWNNLSQVSSNIPSLISHIGRILFLFYRSNADFWEAEQLIIIRENNKAKSNITGAVLTLVIYSYVHAALLLLRGNNTTEVTFKV